METTQHFITAMDSLKLNMVAVDQVGLSVWVGGCELLTTQYGEGVRLVCGLRHRAMTCLVQQVTHKHGAFACQQTQCSSHSAPHVTGRHVCVHRQH